MSDALGRVGGYITGQLAVCLLHGVCSYVVFLIIDLPYAALLAVTVAILDAVPQVGALLGALVALVFAVPLGLVTTVVVVVYFVVYQQVENYVVAPRVFSRAVELSPLAVFVAVLRGRHHARADRCRRGAADHRRGQGRAALRLSRPAGPDRGGRRGRIGGCGGTRADSGRRRVRLSGHRARSRPGGPMHGAPAAAAG